MSRKTTKYEKDKYVYEIDLDGYEPGLYEDTDGDYWLKTLDGLWLYADRLWGSHWHLCRFSPETWNPENLSLESIDPDDIDYTLTPCYVGRRTQ